MIIESITVAGLEYHPQYLNDQQQTWLLAKIDKQIWDTRLRRRVQHYGYRYEYASRSIGSISDYLGNLPNWLMPLVDKLVTDDMVTEKFDQVIINEYQPGQGIAPHVDCVPCFGDTVASISLLSACVMRFTQLDTKAEAELLLEPNSLLVLKGDAHYQWKHGIAARKSDNINGQMLERQRRISLTFRKVLTTI